MTSTPTPTPSTPPTNPLVSVGSPSLSLIQELEAYETKLTAHIALLETYAAAVREHDLHCLPELKPVTAGGGRTVVSVQVINFKEGAAKAIRLEGIPAAFFYEAYRAKMGEVFALAVEKARASVTTKAEEYKARIETERQALHNAEQAFDRFLEGSHGKANTPSNSPHAANSDANPTASGDVGGGAGDRAHAARARRG